MPLPRPSLALLWALSSQHTPRQPHQPLPIGTNRHRWHLLQALCTVYADGSPEGPGRTYSAFCEHENNYLVRLASESHASGACVPGRPQLTREETRAAPV